MKIGILGGSFNPVHIAHMVIAEEALYMLSLDEMFLMPAFIAPHKQTDGNNDSEIRVRLLHKATENTRLKVCEYEVQRKEVSYTIETIRHFSQSHDVTLCIGADSAMQFDTWKDYKEILRLARVAVYPRPGITQEMLFAKWGDVVTYCTMPLFEISSSDIRERIRTGRPYAQMVPRAVAEVIEKERLYL